MSNFNSNFIDMDNKWQIVSMRPEKFRNYMIEKQKELKIAILNSRTLEYSVMPHSKIDDNIVNFYCGDVATLKRFKEQIQKIVDMDIPENTRIIESNQATADNENSIITICHAEVLVGETKSRGSFFCVAKKRNMINISMSFFNVVVVNKK